mgnify:CR=1 FL=1
MVVVWVSSEENLAGIEQNRENLGYDRWLERYHGSNYPGGIAIWHVDDTLVSNANDSHRLADLEAGEPPDDFLDPESLSDSERKRLKEAFQLIASLHDALARRYCVEAPAG